jgi:hypothetical protein
MGGRGFEHYWYPVRIDRGRWLVMSGQVVLSPAPYGEQDAPAGQPVAITEEKDRRMGGTDGRRES